MAHRIATSYSDLETDLRIASFQLSSAEYIYIYIYNFRQKKRTKRSDYLPAWSTTKWTQKIGHNAEHYMGYMGIVV